MIHKQPLQIFAVVPGLLVVKIDRGNIRPAEFAVKTDDRARFLFNAITLEMAVFLLL